MSKTIILSNRLPVTINCSNSKSKPVITESIGGLATGLKSVHSQKDSLWIGWSGLSPDEVTAPQRKAIDEKLFNKYRCLPIYLTDKLVDDF